MSGIMLKYTNYQQPLLGPDKDDQAARTFKHLLNEVIEFVNKHNFLDTLENKTHNEMYQTMTNATEIHDGIRVIMQQFNTLEREESITDEVELYLKHFRASKMMVASDKLPEALIEINKALLHLPVPNPDLPPYHYNLFLWYRSDILTRQKRPHLAIKDLEQVYVHTFPLYLQRVFYRKLAMMYLWVNRNDKAHDVYNKIVRMYEEGSLERHRIHDMIIHTMEPQPIQDNNHIFDFDDDDYGDAILNNDVIVAQGETGSRLQATKIIDIGQLILDESPLACYVIPEAVDVFCCFCNNKSVAPYFCHSCANVGYCSIDCREKAKPGHIQECHLYGIMRDANLSVDSFIGLKLITQIDLNTLKDMYTINAYFFTPALKPEDKDLNIPVVNTGNIKTDDMNNNDKHKNEKSSELILAEFLLNQNIMEVSVDDFEHFAQKFQTPHELTFVNIPPKEEMCLLSILKDPSVENNSDEKYQLEPPKPYVISTEELNLEHSYAKPYSSMWHLTKETLKKTPTPDLSKPNTLDEYDAKPGPSTIKPETTEELVKKSTKAKRRRKKAKPNTKKARRMAKAAKEVGEDINPRPLTRTASQEAISEAGHKIINEIKSIKNFYVNKTRKRKYVVDLIEKKMNVYDDLKSIAKPPKIAKTTNNTDDDFDESTFNDVNPNPAVVNLDRDEDDIEIKDYKLLMLQQNYTNMYKSGEHKLSSNPKDFVIMFAIGVFIREHLVGSLQRNNSEKEDLVLHMLVHNISIARKFIRPIVNGVVNMDRRTSGTLNIGFGMYTCASIFTQNCCPNVSRYFEGNRIVLRTIREISSGETLTDSYMGHFLDVPHDVRQRFMREYYGFKCDCEACQRGWPTYSAMSADKYQQQVILRCLNTDCPRKFLYPGKSFPKYCPTCFTEKDKERLRKHCKIIIKLKNRILNAKIIARRELKVEEAIDWLEFEIKRAHNISAPPQVQLHKAEITLKCLYAIRGLPEIEGHYTF